MAPWGAVTDVLDHPLDDPDVGSDGAGHPNGLQLHELADIPPAAQPFEPGVGRAHRHHRGGGRLRALHAGPAPPGPHPQEHHARRRRHGRPRLGPGLPAGPHPPPLLALGLVARLVRRLPDVPVLHGAPGAGGGGARRHPPVRGGAEAGERHRHPVAAGLRLAVRQAGRSPVPGPAAVLDRRRLLPVRRDLPDLRRQHRVDDGGRVLLLDRSVTGRGLPRRLRLRDAHRKAPRPGRRPLRPGRAVPRHRDVLRRHRRRRAVPAVGGQEAALVRHLRRRRRRPAVRLLVHPVLARLEVHDRHVLRAPQRQLGDALPAVHDVEPGDHRSGPHRPRRVGDPGGAGRRLPRDHVHRLRRVGLPVAAEPPVERPPAAVLLPDP